jgi:hypothetical protein
LSDSGKNNVLIGAAENDVIERPGSNLIRTADLGSTEPISSMSRGSLSAWT